MGGTWRTRSAGEKAGALAIDAASFDLPAARPAVASRAPRRVGAAPRRVARAILGRGVSYPWSRSSVCKTCYLDQTRRAKVPTMQFATVTVTGQERGELAAMTSPTHFDLALCRK